AAATLSVSGVAGEVEAGDGADATLAPARPSRIACGDTPEPAGAVAVVDPGVEAAGTTACAAGGLARPACTTCAVSRAVARAASARASASLAAVLLAVAVAGAGLVVAGAVAAPVAAPAAPAAAVAGAAAVAVAAGRAGPSPGHSITRRAPPGMDSVRTGRLATGSASSKTMR